MTAEQPRFRLGVLGIVVVSLFAALFARLWYLQVMAAPAGAAQAYGNRVRLVYEEAPRGRILDRQGRVLVDNRISNAVVVDKTKLTDRNRVVGRLATLLGVSDAELQRRIADKRASPYKPILLADDVPKDTLVYVREHEADFPGVSGVQITQRAYPQGTVAAHLLGYVGEINGRELASRKATHGYRLGVSIGKSGVEQVYEEDLRGTPGIEKLEVDSRGRVLRSLGSQPAVQGHDVKLSLDLDVQKLAEESLAQGLAAARGAWDPNAKKHFIAPAGAVVVNDPRNGQIVALASYPTFDPASFVNGIKVDDFKAMQDPASYYPLTNRAIQGQYAPGSTFKLVTALAGLGKGIVAPTTTVNDTGSIRIGNQTFRNALGRSYGYVDLVRALTVSSDVYFYKMGADFWDARGRFGDAMQDVAHGLGLGEASNIPLPYEASGRIPDPNVRRRLHEGNPRAFPNGHWYTGDNVNLAIGQGEVVVTPLQLANAYAAFANGGTVYEPQVALAVLDRAGNQVREVTSLPARTVDLPPAMRTPVLQGLTGAIADPKGTAFGAFAGFPLAQFPIAGKTGTAQVFGKQDTSVFCAFGPTNAPRYAISVVMEESGFGASSAAPVARRIFEGVAGVATRPVAVVGGSD
jgi:penicillin-binding protein 2